MAEAVVVRDRQALSRCRQVLDAQHVEGVRFLVLADCPRAPATVERPPLPQGVSGPVRQYIRTAPDYQPLVNWLLNDSWIVEDLDRLLATGVVPQGRMVSTRGDRWDRRSWRFNGRGELEVAGMGRRRLGRKQRWEEATSTRQSVEAQFSRLEADARQAEQEWQSLLSRQEVAKGALSHVAPNLQKLQSQVRELTDETARVHEEQQALDLEIQELATQRQELRASLTAAQQAAEEAQARQQSIERSLADAQSARETTGGHQQQLLIARAQAEATTQSLTERAEAMQARRREVETDRAHLAEQLETISRQSREALARAKELEQQLLAHQQGREQAQAQRGQSAAEVQRVEQRLREEETQRDQLLPQLLAVEQEMSSLMQRIHEQGQQVSERSFRRSRLVERLRELYQIDEATLDAEVRTEAPPLEEGGRMQMQEQAQKLRERLEGMGPVSLGSVEEYDALKRRQDFLQTQQQDLIQARDDLKASITRINRTARTQFREIFAKIKQEFQHYFSRLFGGGQADLILLDEEDVLESGIDIVARPPGKRLQSISLLSGGERALTAIALLFALFKVRPSPFCVLDEIDAPLDEANVDRFTKVLEEFLELSQFILVTHNKKTITKADSLYGVTMQQAGVSKFLSAKLTGADGAPQNPAKTA
jgi:chromosome segregation protein